MEYATWESAILDAITPSRVTHIVQAATKFFDGIERAKWPWTWFAMTAFSLLMARHFLEAFSNNNFALKAPGIFYAHAMVFFLMALVVFTLLLHVMTGRAVSGIAKVMCVAVAALLAAPVVDLLITGGQGLNMRYFLPGKEDNLWMRYLHFFGPFEERGVTPGQKVQIGLLVLGSALYVYVRTRSVFRAIAAAWIGYTFAFVLSMSPVIIHAILSLFGVRYAYSDTLMLHYHFLLLFFAGGGLLAAWNKNVTREVLRDSRPTRLSHLLAMYLLGILVAWKHGVFALEPTTVFTVLLIPVSVYGVMLFSIITNNIVDIEIDNVTNRNRPLVRNAIDRVIYERLGWLLLVFALTSAASMGSRTFLLVGTMASSFFLYSVPPFRLKRVPFFSKALLATPLVTTALLGYHIAGGSIRHFPLTLAIWMLFGFTATLNVIDIKDIEGDRKAGIDTLPNMFGERGKLLIGAFFFLTYVSAALVFRAPFLLPALSAAGGLQGYLIMQKRYYDPSIFAVSLVCLIFLLLYIAFFDASIAPLR